MSPSAVDEGDAVGTEAEVSMADTDDFFLAQAFSPYIKVEHEVVVAKSVVFFEVHGKSV